MLQIERDDISAIEVAFCLQELEGNIMLRKEEQYFSPEIEAEKNKLVEADEFDETMINGVFSSFYG